MEAPTPPPDVRIVRLSWQPAPLSLFSACNAPCPISSRGLPSSSLKSGESSGPMEAIMTEEALIGQQDVPQALSRPSQLIINRTFTESLWPDRKRHAGPTAPGRGDQRHAAIVSYSSLVNFCWWRRPLCVSAGNDVSDIYQRIDCRSWLSLQSSYIMSLSFMFIISSWIWDLYW